MENFEELLEVQQYTPLHNLGIFDYNFTIEEYDSNPMIVIQDRVFQIDNVSFNSFNLKKLDTITNTKTTYTINYDFKSNFDTQTEIGGSKSGINGRLMAVNGNIYCMIILQVNYSSTGIDYEERVFYFNLDTSGGKLSSGEVEGYPIGNFGYIASPYFAYTSGTYYAIINEKIYSSSDGITYSLFDDITTKADDLGITVTGIFSFDGVMYLVTDDYSENIHEYDPITKTINNNPFFGAAYFDSFCNIIIGETDIFAFAVSGASLNNIYLAGLATSQMYIFDLLDIPYINGNLTLEGSVPPDDIMFYDYNFDSQYYFDENQIIYGSKVASSGYKIYLPHFDGITSGELRLGVYGTRPDNGYYSNYMLSSPDTININFPKINTAITTAQELFDVRYYPSGTFTIENDIDLSNFTIPDYHPSYYKTREEFVHYFNMSAGNFPPIFDFWIGDWESDEIWLQLDGKEHTLSNMTFLSNIESTYYNFQYDLGGLFATLGMRNKVDTNIIIKNLSLENFNINGGELIGGLAGKIYESDNTGTSSILIENVHIRNSTIQGEDAASWYSVGGLIGGNRGSSAEIKKCSYIGDLTGDFSAGGLIGYGNREYIHDCFVMGNITDIYGTYGYCAGITGEGFSQTIENCYFVGKISSEGNVDPIVATDQATNPNTVTNCYYNQELIGGKIDIENEFYTGIARTTEQMTYPYQEKNSYLNWDFSEFPDPANYDYPSTVDFANDSDKEIMYKTNDGYPELGPPGMTWFTIPVWIAQGIGLVKFGGNFFWVKKNDTWNSAEGFVKSGGSWHPITLADVKKGGSWD